MKKVVVVAGLQVKIKNRSSLITTIITHKLCPYQSTYWQVNDSKEGSEIMKKKDKTNIIERQSEEGERGR
jgi:hypothetical protein